MTNDSSLPRLKSASKTKQINIPVDPEMKEALCRLKEEHRVDITEWLRQIIRRELDALKIAI